MKSFFFLLAFGSVNLFGQVQINQQFKGGNEPSLVINPKNNAEIVLAFNTNNVFKSKDTGKTFQRIKVSSKFGFYGDPVLVNGVNDDVYLVHLAKNDKLKWPESFDRIVFQSFNYNSKVVKKSVGIGYQLGKMQDKPWLFVQNNTSKRNHSTLHLTWTCFDKYDSRSPQDSTRIMHAYSTDNGAHFSTPQVISKVNGIAVDGDSAMEGATVAMDKINGHLYCLWSGKSQLWMAQSKDGIKWELPYTVSEHINGWNITAPGFWRANGMPFLVALDSHLVAVWASEFNGISKVNYLFYNVRNQTWSDIKTIEVEEGVSSFMPFIQTMNNNAYLVFYGVGKRDVSTWQSEVSVYAAKINELNIDQKVLANKVEGTSFKSKNSFLGDYIALGLFNQSDKEEGLIAFTTLINQKQTSIATVKIKF
jgi:hypothetical protein